MARIAVTVQSVSVNGNSINVGDKEKERDGFLLYDLTKKQQLREHTIHPPGQERYIMSLDRSALLDHLQSMATGTLTSGDMDLILADTRGSGTSSSTTRYSGLNNGDDISDSNVNTVLTNHNNIGSASPAERDKFRNLISRKFTETGQFDLSYDSGVISMLRSNNWVKVFPNDASGLYSP